MRAFAESNWRKYKTDFLRANRCTDQQFHDAYVAFMKKKPDIAAYRKFASKYHITIHASPNVPAHVQVELSVNIAAIKVMAQSYAEAEVAIHEIIGVLPNN